MSKNAGEMVLVAQLREAEEEIASLRERAEQAERENTRLRMVLRGIREMATECIHGNFATSETCVWQVAAAARSALAETYVKKE